MKTVICDQWETQRLILITCTVLLNLPKQSESKIALLLSTFLGLIDQQSNFNPVVFNCEQELHTHFHNFENDKKCFIGVFKD